MTLHVKFCPKRKNLSALCFFCRPGTFKMPARDSKSGNPASHADPAAESDSSYEPITEEEYTPPALPKARPLVAVKSAAAPKPAAVVGDSEESSAETLPSETEELGPVVNREKRQEVEVDESSDSRAGLTREKRDDRRAREERRGRSETRAAEKASKHRVSRKTMRPPEPESPTGKGPGKGPGKGKKGGRRSKCDVCWRRVGPSENARQQHRYWNLVCLCWQQFQTGKHRSWEQACVAAEAQKLRREERARARWEGDPEEPNYPPPDKRGEVGKRPREEPVEKEKKSKKDRKEKKDKKVKHRKRPEAPAASPSPDPVRKHKHHRKPPSSDSEDAGYRPKLKQTGPDTFKVVMG